MHLPADWTRILPPDAPLTTLERWERVFADTKPGDWPEGVDRSSFVLDILRLLAKGTVVAAEAGERLLPTLARKLSDRALEDGPPAALPVTLAACGSRMGSSLHLTRSGLRLYRSLRRRVHSSAFWGSMLGAGRAVFPKTA